MMKLLIHIGTRSYNSGPFSETESQMGAIAFILIILIVIAFIIFRSKTGNSDKDWEKGIIPPAFKYTKNNVLEYYIAAAGSMVLREPETWNRKFKVLKNYVYLEFPNEYYDIHESYQFSIKYCVKTTELVKWANKHFDKNRKIHFIEFLVFFGSSDGTFTENEKEFVFYLLYNISVSIDELKLEWQEKLTTNYSKSMDGTSNTRLLCLKKLGLSEFANAQEIKEAYRNLVKRLHPDTTFEASLEEKAKLEEKFREVQEAYDNLIGKG